MMLLVLILCGSCAGIRNALDIARLDKIIGKSD